MKKERENLLKSIQFTFETLKQELSKFDQEKLNQVPFEGSWTAGQAAEHIIICGDGIPDSNTTTTERAYDEKVGALKGLFLNFEIKFEADPSIAPGQGPHDKDTLIHKIMGIKSNLENVAKTTDLTSLCEDMEFPTFGFLTRYEWLQFILFHTQRHTNQITIIGKHLIA
ncbi:DinB family protein [Algoriphagus resistens]|uniref:DinB family protein n=1 Tax=Algoriphagus resistens TaxID=1750590 RepID=UPI000716A60D|nr:DinB family protein [Algoriphagus resistens]